MPWSAVPARVAAALERRLGATVVGATSQEGGFSEGVAARLLLADGRRVFVKAASHATAPVVATFHRREITVSGMLPPVVPAPALLHAYDDGDWVGLVFEDVEGRLPAQPWRQEELDLVLDTLNLLAIMTTPCSVPHLRRSTPRLGGWADLAHDRGAIRRLGEGMPEALRAVDTLVALERCAPEVLTGDTLVHGDLYAFNVLVAPDRAILVDWPHAWIGPKEFDLMTLLTSAALGGVDPERVVRHHPLTARSDRRRLDVLLALHSGFLMRSACTAGPDADEAIVDMQTALGHASLRWLPRRL